MAWAPFGGGHVSSDFSKVEAFAGLDKAGLEALERAAHPVAVRGGDYVVRFGEHADALYLVSTGRFYVQLPGGRVIAEIGAGEPIGELAFFSGCGRTADVRASRDSVVYKLTRQAYDGIVARHPAVAEIDPLGAFAPAFGGHRFDACGGGQAPPGSARSSPPPARAFRKSFVNGCAGRW